MDFCNPEVSESYMQTNFLLLDPSFCVWEVCSFSRVVLEQIWPHFSLHNKPFFLQEHLFVWQSCLHLQKYDGFSPLCWPKLALLLSIFDLWSLRPAGHLVHSHLLSFLTGIFFILFLCFSFSFFQFFNLHFFDMDAKLLKDFFCCLYFSDGMPQKSKVGFSRVASGLKINF